MLRRVTSHLLHVNHAFQRFELRQPNPNVIIRQRVVSDVQLHTLVVTASAQDVGANRVQKINILLWNRPLLHVVTSHK